MIRFTTKQQAIEAGYRPVDRKRDRDISNEGTGGSKWFGYDFRNPDGEETVEVWLTDETNKIGNKGAVSPMYPPKK